MARREVEPACQIPDLPPIDLVVLSHYHGDHFDDVAAQDLATVPASVADDWLRNNWVTEASG
jgi:L-ascorbate metabolism protein UlaG (beta-lactamase superfamily)